MVRFIAFILSSFLLSCLDRFGSTQPNSININRTENQLIPIIDSLKLTKVELTKKGLLIINDTLIHFDNDSTRNPQKWVKDSIDASSWTNRHKSNLKTLTHLKQEFIGTNNYRIIKDFDAYFCSEGGFIDSNFGIAYRFKDNMPIDLKAYEFDRVQTMDKIDKFDHWYSYYAD